MKVIYHCYGGTHTSIVAASIHAGKLKNEEVPDIEELFALKYFDSLSVKDYGKLHYIGNDYKDNEIYSCGMKNDAYIVKNAVKDILMIYNEDPEELYFVSTIDLITMNIRVGGFLSRRMGLISIGRPLVIRAIRSNYSKIVSFVKDVKKDLS